MTGTVYTETVVHLAAEEFVSEVPYQVAIIEGGDRRVTGRIAGERVSIGDSVMLIETREGVPFFKKST